MKKENKKKKGQETVQVKTMAKSKSDAQFVRTAANLKRKGKTNKKLKSNPNAKKYDQSQQERYVEKATRKNQMVHNISMGSKVFTRGT